MEAALSRSIRELHKKYAPSEAAFENVWGHSDIVCQIAIGIANTCQVGNIDLISAGALLHDIGVYKLYKNGEIDEKNYVMHGLLGYELLKEEGFAEELCRFALLHTGVGITTADIESNHLALPARDYLAETQEEKIVMYADKFHSKTRPPVFNSVGWYRNYLKHKFGDTKEAIFVSLVDEFGAPDLRVLAAKYKQQIR